MATPAVILAKPELAPDRFLRACRINYEFPHLFLYLVEMEYIPETGEIHSILKYPEVRDVRFFKDEAHMTRFESDIKKFAFPYKKIQKENLQEYPAPRISSNLVQFYTFVLTDDNAIRQYGFCRSVQGGNHIICLISYLPWYTVIMQLINKIATIINEKETQSLYHFLDAIYEYELPKPGCFAEIFPHDGTDSYCFYCPDRRLVPKISENRNLQKFFNIFDLEKIIKIFTALLLDRHILIVSKDLENLTSCALSLESLIYPLEWFQTFAPIMHENFIEDTYSQPFPFIYGIHPYIYERLTDDQKRECMVLMVDDHRIVVGDVIKDDVLPDNVSDQLRRKLKFFQETSGSGSSSASNKHDTLLHTGTIQAFLDSVLMIIDDYRSYLKFDMMKNEYVIDEDTYFQMKNVYSERKSKNYFDNEFKNEFYHQFRITQSFEEFCRDRGDYMKAEDDFNLRTINLHPRPVFQKDFVETLFEQFNAENSKTNPIKKKFDELRKNAKENVKEMRKFLNQATGSTPSGIVNPIRSSLRKSSIKKHDSIDTSSNFKIDLFNSKKCDQRSRSSSSSESSAVSSKVNEEKNKFNRASESIDITIEKDLDEFSKEINFALDSKNRLTMDLTNDPDIQKLLKKENEPKLIDQTKLIDIETELPSFPTSQVFVTPSNPFGMDQFTADVQTSAFNNTFKAELYSRSWLEDEINKSIEPLKPQPETPEINKKVTQYQSIIDEFDPMSSSSVKSKVNHFNQMKSSQSTYLNSLTSKPFTPVQQTSQLNSTQNRTSFDYLKNCQTPSGINKISTVSQYSIKDLMNPTPFYGGYKNSGFSQPNFQSVPLSITKSLNSSNGSDLINLQTKESNQNKNDLTQSKISSFEDFLNDSLAKK